MSIKITRKNGLLIGFSRTVESAVNRPNIQVEFPHFFHKLNTMFIIYLCILYVNYHSNICVFSVVWIIYFNYYGRKKTSFFKRLLLINELVLLQSLLCFCK